MHQKELRLALICYGGVSLAVYMHGITKEVWRLAAASRAVHAGDPCDEDDAYAILLRAIEEECGVRLRVLVDIIAGASAGGINGVFLSQAIVRGQSLDPLTDLWLDTADVDVLIDPGARPSSRFTKFWAAPLAWAASSGRDGIVARTIDPEVQEEVRAKLSSFVRARWFEPPFSGKGFTGLLLNALEAMAAAPSGPPLLPTGQPLDLFVTVTDFHGHPERLRIHSPTEVNENEHRLTIAFKDRGGDHRTLGDIASLAMAARATASFPGAFPPFTVGELDGVLAEREMDWPERDAFLARALPRHAAIDAIESAILIDGSVLANAPFRPAIDALRDRPSRREVDRRFVYIDPKSDIGGMRLGRGGGNALPGFFATIFGALSDIPREQPISDNLDAIAGRTDRIDRMRHIVEAIRPEVNAEIERLFGGTLFLNRPTANRLSAWRNKAHDVAAKTAGFGYVAYGHLKISGAVDEIAAVFAGLSGATPHRGRELRQVFLDHLRDTGIDHPGSVSAAGPSADVIAFFRAHDLGFRIRRMRFLVRSFSALEQRSGAPAAALGAMRDAIYATLAPYLDRQRSGFYGEAMPDARIDPGAALSAIAIVRDLASIDRAGDGVLATALAGLPKAERREMLLAYLGFPFFDIATLPLLQGEGLDEFDPIKVDRIAPEDATAIRTGGAAATLKGIALNSFGAFFSRAYRENDYLWGRLHGIDRLIDIVVSALPEGSTLPPGRTASIKRAAFRALLASERPRLTRISDLFDSLEQEIG